MGGGGQTSTTSTGDPATRRLRQAIGGALEGRLPGLFDMFDQGLAPNPQQIPGLTGGQEAIRAFQGQRAFGPILNSSEQQALGQINQLTSGPLGSAPATLAAMQAVRDPALNDLAMAGLGNSTEVAGALGRAYAPILAQEQAMRFGVIPQLQQLGQTEAGRQSQFLSEFGQSEEAARQIEAQRDEAEYLDFLRRQEQVRQGTTGILGSTAPTSIQRTSGSGGGILK